MKRLLVVVVVLLVFPCVGFAGNLQDPGPIFNDMRIPADYYEKFISSGVSQIPSPLETSDYMYGDVSVAVILLESNGAIDPETEDWTQNRIDQVHSKIQDGLNWWITNKHSLAEVSFTYHYYELETSYEPITRTTGVGDYCTWINEVMDYLGYTEGCNASVRSFNNDLRNQDNTDWAFTIFVVDSLNDENGRFEDYSYAFSYLQGPCMVMTYDNNGYGIGHMDAVTAHETGHIFGAGDEYDAPCYCTSTYGFLQVENQNCVNDCLSAVDCIMRGGITSYANNSLEYYSEVQVGWRDLNENGIIDCIDVEYNPDTDTDGDGIINYWDECTDTDGDGYGNPSYPNTCAEDNCPNNYNPDQDDYDKDGIGDICDECTDADGDGYANPGFPINTCELDNCPDTPNPSQEDQYPSQGNGIGDACDCECDFTCDGDVDADDVTAFLADFGREQYYLPCTNETPCSGDVDCDVDVDADDVSKFLEDFGREQYYNPCPACVVEEWCVYP